MYQLHHQTHRQRRLPLHLWQPMPRLNLWIQLHLLQRGTSNLAGLVHRLVHRLLRPLRRLVTLLHLLHHLRWRTLGLVGLALPLRLRVHCLQPELLAMLTLHRPRRLHQRRRVHLQLLLALNMWLRLRSWMHRKSRGELRRAPVRCFAVERHVLFAFKPAAAIAANWLGIPTLRLHLYITDAKPAIVHQRPVSQRIHPPPLPRRRIIHRKMLVAPGIMHHRTLVAPGSHPRVGIPTRATGSGTPGTRNGCGISRLHCIFKVGSTASSELRSACGDVGLPCALS